MAHRLIGNENVLCIYENLSFGVDNYKQIKFEMIFKSEFLIEVLEPRPIMNENVISIYQNLSLGADSYKKNQI